MRFRHTWTSRGSPIELFIVHRDELERFAPTLDGVDSVQTLERKAEGSSVWIRRRWRGERAALPWALRPLAQHFVWTDHGTWSADTLRGEWQIEVPRLGSMVRIAGQHRFSPHEGGCLVEVEGDVEVAVIGGLGGATADNFVQQLFGRILDSATPAIEAQRTKRDRTRTTMPGISIEAEPRASTESPVTEKVAPSAKLPSPPKRMG